MKKVLIIYNKLFIYRIPIFELLSEKYDLTVIYSIGDNVDKSYNFRAEKKEIWKMNRFTFHKGNLFNFCKQFDVVISYGEISWLSLSLLAFIKKRKYKLIYWTIGVSASYNKSFGQKSKWDKIRDFIYKQADALIFYTEYPIKRYLENGFQLEKLFVAPNTVKVEACDDSLNEKTNLLFIGSLYVQKGVMSLLDNYKKALRVEPNLYNLELIGGGEDYNHIKAWITENGLQEKIKLLGPIFDEKLIAKHFKSAIACISPFQSGLSVLKSMGYGVPFITMNNSITGGERLNIIDGSNGVLYSKESDLLKIILDTYQNPSKYYIMGQSAKDYYYNKRKPEAMAEGIINAIEYTLHLDEK